MAIQIQVRRDTAANWTSEDPTLAEGEFGMETDTFQLKIGDGATAWVGLPYVVDSANPFDQDLNTTDPVEFTGLTSNGLTFPTADGTAGQVIETDGAGVLSFASIGGVSSLTAGTGISLDVTTGDITVTNSEPDQTVTLTNGTGITITGTYPSFTIDCDITQYTDTDARLALSAGTGISYDDTTGIITNDEPDQTVTLTNGADITITGTYPSFTIAYSGTPSSGTVTKTSVVSANGFAGSVATDTTTPAITISTSITGLLKGNGTAISAATSGTDYVVPSGSITGNAATVTTNADLTGVITSKGNATSIASQTGTGSKFVVDTSPTLVTPDIGAATGTSLTLSGDLTVNGTTTTISSTTLAVGDKNIVLASASTTDAGADGGGITLKGTSDHTWNWIDSTDAWTSSDHINLASGKSFYINGTAVLSATALGSGISVTATTNANLTGVITSVGNATSIASQTGTGTKFVMDTSPTLITPVLGTPTSGTLTNCTFPTLNQNTTGSAATVTTNANLTGVITSTGNATVIASQTGTGTKFVVDTSPTLVTPTIGAATATSVNKITLTAPATGATLTIADGATLTASATASVSGTNTGDNATNTAYSSLVSNATHTGDATGATALTVVKINGVLMSGLATGILKNTTTTGVPSIATAGTDYVAPSGALGTPTSGTLTNCTFPTLNQSTTGNASTVTTNANLTGVITSVGNATSIASQTGTGTKFVVDTSPTLITPVLGTPTSGTLTNCTFPTLNQNTTGNAATVTTNADLTGVITSTGNATVIASQTGTGTKFVMDTSPTLVTPVLGTPSSGTLTSCTGLPVSTGVSGLGTNVATFLATPSSANLAAALTDETGSGLAVFATSPTLTTATITSLVETKTAPAISSGTLTLNCSLGNVFAVSLNAAITTLTISNIPTTGNAFGITLAFTCDGTARAVTWGAAVKWSGGTAPTLTSTNAKVDIFVLTTWDGGTTWYAMVGGQNF